MTTKQKRRVKRIVRRVKPFRGMHSYESQIGPIVVQIRHRDAKSWSGLAPNVARVNVFIDPYWSR